MSITVVHAAQLTPQEQTQITAELGGEWEAGARCWRLHHPSPATGAQLARLRAELALDLNPLPEGFAPEAVRLVISDMDSTLIGIECVDEIADFAGRKAEVAAVTEAAMRGEIDFATSLVRRVAALEGLAEAVLEQVYGERLRLNPGGTELLAGLAEGGIAFALVSGGFTFFTERLRRQYGFAYAHANHLEIAGGRLTGRVRGEIVDAQVKRRFLQERCSELGIDCAQTVAVGDGANDLPMLAQAGLGIAYRAKPKVQAQADAVLNYAGLSAILDLTSPAHNR